MLTAYLTGSVPVNTLIVAVQVKTKNILLKTAAYTIVPIKLYVKY